jgi:predicted nucleotidyltransferase
MSQLGQKLRALRKERKLTLSQVSEETGIDIAILSKIERGERRLSKPLVEKLAVFYGVDPEPLIVSALNEQLLQQYGQDELGQQAIMAAEQEVAYAVRPSQPTEKARYALPINEIKQYFRNQHLVSKAWIFGSMAREDYTESSDVDIMIEVPETTVFTFFDLADVQEHLERITQRKVDVVMYGALRPLMKEYVERDMILIYEK